MYHILFIMSRKLTKNNILNRNTIPIATNKSIAKLCSIISNYSNTINPKDTENLFNLSFILITL